MAVSGAQQLADFSRASHLTVPDDVQQLIVTHAQGMGAHDAALYLVDYEQRMLVPLPMRDGRPREELVIDGTLAGRCYRTLDMRETAGE